MSDGTRPWSTLPGLKRTILEYEFEGRNSSSSRYLPMTLAFSRDFNNNFIYNIKILMSCNWVNRVWALRKWKKSRENESSTAGTRHGRAGQFRYIQNLIKTMSLNGSNTTHKWVKFLDVAVWLTINVWRANYSPVEGKERRKEKETCRWQDPNHRIPESSLILTWIASTFKVFCSLHVVACKCSIIISRYGLIGL